MEERRLRRSQEVLIGNEIPKVRRKTEEVFVDGVEKPEMVEGPVESREGVEVKILDGVSVSAEADVDVAECSESVELAGEEISDVAGVVGEKELLPILSGVLYPLSHELTMRRDELSFPPLPEWGQEILAACFIGGVIAPEMNFRQKLAVGYWWSKSVGRLSSSDLHCSEILWNYKNQQSCERGLVINHLRSSFKGVKRISFSLSSF
jgi:hypothetical protein